MSVDNAAENAGTGREFQILAAKYVHNVHFVIDFLVFYRFHFHSVVCACIQGQDDWRINKIINRVNRDKYSLNFYES
jgi:hypothetical protein